MVIKMMIKQDELKKAINTINESLNLDKIYLFDYESGVSLDREVVTN